MPNTKDFKTSHPLGTQFLKVSDKVPAIILVSYHLRWLTWLQQGGVNTTPWLQSVIHRFAQA